MTEDEAKTKWCPFSRELSQTYTQQGEFRVSTGYSYNRSPDPDDDAGPYVPSGSLCLGSACMAWRWEKTGDFRGKIDAIREHRDRHGSSLYDAKNAVEATWTETPNSGYCGLAGAVK